MDRSCRGRTVSGAILAGLLVVSVSFAAETPVVFLDAKAAAEVMAGDRADAYTDLLQSLEMVAKSGRSLEGDLTRQREEFRARYRDAVREFSDAEKALIRSGIEAVQPWLEKNFLVLATAPWSLIKVSRNVESGLPHTRGAHIVISAPILNWIASMGTDEPAPFLINMLVHEKMHVVQRAHQDRFDALYSGTWRFREVEKIAGDQPFVEAQVINPDGTNRWVWSAEDGETARWIWPTLRINPPASGAPNLMLNMEMIAVPLERKGRRFIVRTDSSGDVIWSPLEDETAFAAAFPYTDNLYHPNEITADAMGRHVVAELFGAPAPSGTEFDALLDWFRKALNPGRADR